MSDKEQEVPIPVKDWKNEIMTGVIAIAAIITIPLVGVIGNRILDNMDRMADNQIKINESIGKINGYLGAYNGRISRNKDDIHDVNVKVDSNTQRISTLEGKR